MVGHRAGGQLMPTPAEQPRFDQPVVDQSGRVTRAWADYFLRMASAQTSGDLRQLYEQLAARVAALEDGEQLNFRILGQQSISVAGVVQPGGVVVTTLANDTAAPGNTAYYGTGPDGSKGWFPIASAIEVVAGELTKGVGPDGVTTFGLADVPDVGGGFLQKTQFDAKGRKTGTSSATTDDLPEGDASLYYTDERAAAAAPVQSVNDQTGDVVLTAADVGAATAEQGALADSALQEIVPGTGITVDNTDPQRPVVSAVGGGSSFVPFYIPDGQQFAVPQYQQALFTLPIEIGDGAGIELDGALEEVS